MFTLGVVGGKNWWNGGDTNQCCPLLRGEKEGKETTYRLQTVCKIPNVDHLKEEQQWLPKLETRPEYKDV